MNIDVSRAAERAILFVWTGVAYAKSVICSQKRRRSLGSPEESPYCHSSGKNFYDLFANMVFVLCSFPPALHSLIPVRLQDSRMFVIRSFVLSLFTEDIFVYVNLFSQGFLLLLFLL